MKIIKIIKALFISAVVVASISVNAWAVESFVVRDVKVTGLHRIQLGTVLNYMPLRMGQRLTQSKTSKIISALYRTGFFNNVSLSRQGSTLVIHVVERPTIGVVKTRGNKDIPKEKFNSLLKNIGLVQGHVFDRSVLDRVKQELKNQYNNRGKYNARIEVTVSKMKRNRVAVDIDISEGRVAKIREIRIIGNSAFSDKQLKKHFIVSTPGILTWFSQKDQYSKEKLDASLESMHSFYMDNGFIKAKVESTQVSLTPDRKSVYITVKVTEGPRYHFSGFKLAGKFVLPKEELTALVHIKKGDVFSRSAVNDGISEIGTAIGNVGYGFPAINGEPIINEKNKTIFVTIYIDPGVRVYVRRIEFSGNTKTADYVLHHAMRQDEGALLKISNIKESERQLRNLGYFKNVSVKTKAVPGTNNQIDLNYRVTETPSTTATASIGYSSAGKFQFNAGVNEPNFLGTGRTVGINFASRADLKDISLNYYNPYYSNAGIGRGFNVYYQRTEPGKGTTVSDYTANRYGGDVNYNIALSDYNNFNVSGGYERLELADISASTPQYAAFQSLYGTDFHMAHLTAGWSFNSYDRGIFPTKGYRQQVTAKLTTPIVEKSLFYYKLGYTGHAYVPLFKGFILSLQSGLAYGDGLGSTKGLPFFENYYAGGIGGQGQVRGFDSYSLGPRDPNNKAIGGNFLISGSVGLILPYPASRETFRTSLFVDGGNVYAAYGRDVPKSLQGGNEGPFRFSAGVGIEWRSPFGPLQFSFAVPLNKQKGDKVQMPQFNIATGF